MDTRAPAAPAAVPHSTSQASPRTATGRGSAAPAVRLDGLTKRFGSVEAVRGIDLTIEQGEVVAFLGPNGAGKTSTIDVLLGLSRPTSGSVEVCGVSPREAIANGWVSAVMQTGGLHKDLSVRETVELTASLFATHQDVDAVLRGAGIDDIADRRVAKCSGGQQQRLRFAMALLPDPRLLLLDEPTTGMDVEGRRAFWSSIRADAERGRTIVFATHYLEEADAYADRVVLVSRGRIVADGTTAQVKALSSGRTIRATWPGVTQRDLQDLRDVRGLPGLEEAASADIAGDTLTIRTSDSDAVARHLLTATPARDLEITARGLEDAFIALTGDGEGSAPSAPTHTSPTRTATPEASR